MLVCGQEMIIGENTEPISLPARIEFSGTWHCNLCPVSGTGSLQGYHLHYADHHK